MYLVIGSSLDKKTQELVPFQYVVAENQEVAKSLVQENKEKAKLLQEKLAQKQIIIDNYIQENPSFSLSEDERKVWLEKFVAFKDSLFNFPEIDELAEEDWHYIPVAKKDSTVTIDVPLPLHSAEVGEYAIFADHQGQVDANTYLDVGTKLYDEASMLEFAKNYRQAHLNKS